ncbi:MAG: DNA repair protein RadA [Alphaproteobacteria bacterium 16-39-46]|nr:MAG: DNA repair protein RadA [Alphaproteobacteria bacterium 16-39-46]OZA44155.1 MAG: DNA repair protein RadA [Alphaproteobacteria bacterium 17-39-52]HQS83501.1 DNA repair protein RadA [Alphaproteobacteria bacterium]HQS93269.1 DNA repair protein RadA [Alphaproteobacteria bacterium]
MSKLLIRYVCQSCGTSHPKWGGKCTGCDEWNTLLEDVISSQHLTEKKQASKFSAPLEFSSLLSQEAPLERVKTGISEFDRVIGGGLVPGSVLLVGGDPGIGKSTLLLQVAALISQFPGGCAYISGEEGLEQIRLRAKRLGLENYPVLLATETQTQKIISHFKTENPPSFFILDSIQTLYVEGIDAAPGTVTQVRAATHEIIRAAKEHNITVFLIGHVTKEGTLAGPRLLEHMVDTVLYFEGERSHHFRILRTIKNRFGPTNEIGVFDMTDRGLQEVSNPSQLFIGNHEKNISGMSIFAGLEGTRPLLVEIQALVAPTPFGTPRRTTVGWDYGRLCMILAVLEARCGYSFSNRDVYLNVTGGLRIGEPAADLAVACALISAYHNKALPKDAVFLGEVGLSGDIRAVTGEDMRLKEALKLGFLKAFIPYGFSERHKHFKREHLEILEIKTLKDLFMLLFKQEQKQ